MLLVIAHLAEASLGSALGALCIIYMIYSQCDAGATHGPTAYQEASH